MTIYEIHPIFLYGSKDYVYVNANASYMLTLKKLKGNSKYKLKISNSVEKTINDSAGLYCN